MRRGLAGRALGSAKPRNDFEVFFASYLRTALWSSTDSDGNPLDEVGAQWDDATVRGLRTEAARFYEENYVDINDGWFGLGADEQAGHDLWLTRNGHGAGFWDGDWREPQAARLDAAAKRYGEVDLYVGDDELIYASGYEDGAPGHETRGLGGGVGRDEPTGNLYRVEIWTGPVYVNDIAEALEESGVRVSAVGTEKVYVSERGSDGHAAAWNVLAALQQTYGTDFGVKPHALFPIERHERLSAPTPHRGRLPPRRTVAR